MTEPPLDFSLPASGPVFSAFQRNVFRDMGLSGNRVVNIRQVHGAEILNVTEEDCGLLSEDLPQADGVITCVPGLVLAVRTADCVPVFLFDPVSLSAGLIHAGWRSAKARIVELAVTQMRKAFGSYPGDIRAVFGPSIHACCYQVGEQLCDVFPDEIIRRDGHWFLDLQAVCRSQMMSEGVHAGNIKDCGLCTFCSSRFFSYRRQGVEAGRQLSLLRMNGSVPSGDCDV